METLLQLGDKFPMAGEYLLTMFLIERDYRHVSNARVAERMKVTRPAVSQAMKRLSSLGLVEKKQGLYYLNDNGREFAVCLLKRHYLLEHLLVNTLGYPWDKADKEAHLLQDKISTDFTDYLCEKIGQPQACPHGNPFPDSPLESKLLGARELGHFPMDSVIRILRITEEGEEFPGLLHWCLQFNIRPGSKIQLIKKDTHTLIIQDLNANSTVEMPLEYVDYIRGEHWKEDIS